jgi:hypothetical protein
MLEKNEGEKVRLAASKVHESWFFSIAKEMGSMFTMTAIPILDRHEIVSIDNLVAFIHLSTLRRLYDDIVRRTHMRPVVVQTKRVCSVTETNVCSCGTAFCYFQLLRCRTFT